MAGLANFRCESHPRLCLRGVMFSDVMRWGCVILLSVGFAVSLGQRKFSALAFSYVLRRPSLSCDALGMHLLGLLLGFFFCGCSCCACGFAQRALPQITLRLLCNFSGYVCLSCSCADGVGWVAAFPFGFSVLLSAVVKPVAALAAAGFGECPCKRDRFLGSVSRQARPRVRRPCPSSSLEMRSSHGPVRRTAHRLETTCVRNRGVVKGRAAMPAHALSCDPLSHSTGRLMVLPAPAGLPMIARCRTL